VSWWTTKTRQALRHMTGRISRVERVDLRDWLTPAQLALFESMHRADQRHGLDVRAHLLAAGHDDPDLLVAALLHDCAKGRSVGLVHRVAWSLGERYGDGVRDAFDRLPGFRTAFERLRVHAEASARLAREAGCNERTVELIHHQAAPTDPVAGLALRLADEAS
jgi:hypothetical protein